MLLLWVIKWNASGQTPGTPNTQCIVNAVWIDCHRGWSRAFLDSAVFHLSPSMPPPIMKCVWVYTAWFVFIRQRLWVHVHMYRKARQRELLWNSKEINTQIWVKSWRHVCRTVWALLGLRLWSRPIYSSAARVKTDVYHAGALLAAIIPPNNVIHAHKCA